jgi:hypothetical protein
VVERSHVGKFCGRMGMSSEKRSSLKVAGLGRNKKQKTPAKVNINEVVHSIVEEGKMTMNLTTMKT